MSYVFHWKIHWINKKKTLNNRRDTCRNPFASKEKRKAQSKRVNDKVFFTFERKREEVTNHFESNASLVYLSYSLSNLQFRLPLLCVYIYIFSSSCVFFLYITTMVLENESPTVRLRQKFMELSSEYSKEKQIHSRSRSANSRPPTADLNASLRYRQMRRKVDVLRTQIDAALHDNYLIATESSVCILNPFFLCFRKRFWLE